MKKYKTRCDKGIKRPHIKKDRLGQKTKELWQNPEYRKRMSDAHKGKKQSKKTIEKRMSKLRRENAPNWQGGLIAKACRYCGIIFKVDKHRKDTAKFCSMDCYAKDMDKGITPKNEKIRKSKAYKAWRTLVFERDDYTCRVCFIKGGMLHADHIKPFALYPKLRFDVNNGRTLCIKCHKKTHTYGGRIRNYEKTTKP